MVVINEALDINYENNLLLEFLNQEEYEVKEYSRSPKPLLFKKAS
jgi:hypothetical protein